MSRQINNQIGNLIGAPIELPDLKKGLDFSGWCCMDDLVLAAEGVTDFDQYSVTPGAELQLDFFFPHDTPAPEDAGGSVGWRVPQLTGLG